MIPKSIIQSKRRLVSEHGILSAAIVSKRRGRREQGIHMEKGGRYSLGFLLDLLTEQSYRCIMSGRLYKVTKQSGKLEAHSMPMKSILCFHKQLKY